MPTFQYEAMDKTGQEIKDVVEAADQDEAQATIKQMGYFVTKIAVKKSPQDSGQEERRQEGQDLRPGRRQLQNAHHLHPPVVHLAGRRPAHSSQPENPANSSPSPAP